MLWNHPAVFCSFTQDFQDKCHRNKCHQNKCHHKWACLSLQNSQFHTSPVFIQMWFSKLQENVISRVKYPLWLHPVISCCKLQCIFDGVLSSCRMKKGAAMCYRVRIEVKRNTKSMAMCCRVGNKMNGVLWCCLALCRSCKVGRCLG